VSLYAIKVLIALPGQGFQLLFMILCECQCLECQNSLIQCSTSRFFVSIPIPWIYSFVMNNRNSSTYIGTVRQHFQCFDITGDRVTRFNNGERPGNSIARLFLFVVVEIIKCVTWYTETLCIVCLRFDVHLSLAYGYCYNVICI